MYRYILDILNEKNIVKKQESTNGDIKTCFVVPALVVPADIPIFSVEVKSVRDVVDAQQGTLLLFDPDLLNGELRFLERVFEDPSAFGMNLVFVKHFPDSKLSVVVERLSAKLPSILFDEWKSSLLAAVSTAASAKRNPSNDRVLEISSDRGEIKGEVYDTALDNVDDDEDYEND